MPAGARVVRLPFVVSSVTQARGLITEAFEARATASEVVMDANIVVGELVMNAIRHGQPLAGNTVEIAWANVADALRFSVVDAGHVEQLVANMPAVTSVGGRGLAMVELICARWGYYSDGETRIVADIPDHRVA